jgi:hypothetical protein
MAGVRVFLLSAALSRFEGAGVAFLSGLSRPLFPLYTPVEKPLMNSAVDFSEKMKDIATQVVVLSALALLGGILSAINSTPPMGEMGDFMYVFSRVTACFGIWGLATGIGLWRRWRWARVSMIVFGVILVVCGALLPVVILLPVGGAADWTWKFILLKVAGLALLALVLLGGVRWWKFFTQSSMNAYFLEDRVDMKREPGDRKLLAKLGGFALLALIVAISIPNLRVSPVATNQASSVGLLRRINAAQTEHARLHPEEGFAPSLAKLGSPSGDGTLHTDVATRTKRGYVFTLTAAPPDSNGRISKYTVTARPRRFGKDGFRNFFIDETGIVRVTGEDRAATAQDPSL